MEMTRRAESGRQVRRTLGPVFLALSVVAVPNLAAAQATTQAPPAADQSAFVASAVFDVASIRKFSNDGGPMFMSMHFDPDGLTVNHMSVKSLICMAYKVNDYQVSGGPSWVQSDLYDVHAKMDDAAADMLKKLSHDEASQARQHMGQALLADRFKLALHHETRQLPAFALVVAKGGAKLHEAKAGDEYKDGLKDMEGHAGGKGMMRTDWDGGAMTLTAQGLSMDYLARQLYGQVHSKVENETGLKGEFDFTLRYAPEDGGAALSNPAGSSASLADNPAPPIFTALQEQLGLKLESKKVPVDVIVIDHIEAPSEN